MANKWLDRTSGYLAIFIIIMLVWSAAYPNLSARASSDPLFDNMVFGLGPEASDVFASPLANESNVKILTCWVNSRIDIDTWFRQWAAGGSIDHLWDAGYVIHIITYGWLENHASQQFVDDMDVLSKILSRPDDGKHYVLFSLATEFQTYVQPNNMYNSQTAQFYDRLMLYLREAKNVIKANAPNARVSVSWGGWQARNDDPANGEGRSMFKYFADLMKEMDFMSFQLCQGDGNIGSPHDDLQAMIDAISPYNSHLMVAHFKPVIDFKVIAQAVFNTDVANLFTDDYMAAIRQKGLFAFSFMDADYLKDPAALEAVITGINAYTTTLVVPEFPTVTANILVLAVLALMLLFTKRSQGAR